MKISEYRRHPKKYENGTESYSKTWFPKKKFAIW